MDTTFDSSPKHVALLRGINVGGKNRLPMRDLVALFEQAGCRRIQTYIQSGNVVFDANSELAGRIPEAISTSIAREFGLKVPVVVRSAAELSRAVRANPFLSEDVDLKTLHVAFLADPADPKRLASLDPDRSPPDRFVVKDREIYLHCPNGVARSKLTNAYFDSRLRTISTIRNWKTTLQLLQMCS